MKSGRQIKEDLISILSEANNIQLVYVVGPNGQCQQIYDVEVDGYGDLMFTVLNP